MTNLLTEWLRTYGRDRLQDMPVQVGPMTFHLPFNGCECLMFKCARCGWCCNNQKQGALMLTLGDIRRLTKRLGYPGMTKFLEAECVWTETREPKEVYLLSGDAYDVENAGYYLKRSADETEETIHQPRRCRFLTRDNLCEIQDAKLVVCRKFPYIVSNPDRRSTYHAYYADVYWSGCQGYRPKMKVKLPWLIPWVKPLIEGINEIYETVENNLMQITSIRPAGSLSQV